MVKSTEDAIENYVISVGRAMWNYKKHLMRDRNFKQHYAIEKSIDYGLPMLRTGLGSIVTPELAASYFREMASIYTALADWCERNKDAL